MKQRTRLMHSGDDLTGFTMDARKNDEDGSIQMSRMKPQEHFIEAQVQEEDSLQAIALRFRCTVSELKRINQIHKDNEIYARRTIKVPVTPYSVLTELVPTQQPEPVASASSSNEVPKNPLDSVLPSIHNNNSPRKDFSIDCNEVVMNSTLAPAVMPYTDGDTIESVSEDTQLLPAKEKVPVETIVVKQLTSQGADFGIKWYHLVCCLLVLGVVIPLVYVMFYVDKHVHEVPEGNR